MSLTPARDQKEIRKREEAIELCGKNRGSHNYIPIEWNISATAKRVTKLLCLTCFSNVAVSELISHYPDISF